MRLTLAVPYRDVGAPQLADKPIGWRFYGREDDRSWAIFGPAWYYPLWWLWRHRWAPVAALCARGLLWTDREGGYYRTARPAWYWRWKAGDTAPWFDQPGGYYSGGTAYEYERRGCA